MLKSMMKEINVGNWLLDKRVLAFPLAEEEKM